MTPCSAIDAASSASSSSSKRARGWCGLRPMRSTGISTAPDSPSWRGISASRPRPRPKRLATRAHLPGQPAVSIRAARGGIVELDGQPMAGGLGEPDGTWHDRVEDRAVQVPADLRRNLGGELGAPVVHGEEDALDLEARIQPVTY